MFGPPADVVSKNGADSIDMPRPSSEEGVATKKSTRSTTRSNPLNMVSEKSPHLKINSGSLPKRHCHQSDASLSTIAEESGSYVSQSQENYTNALPLTSQSLNAASVFVEPEIVVETTTHPLVSVTCLITIISSSYTCLVICFIVRHVN